MSSQPGSACPCADRPDPQVVSNPPGLGAISYRVDDFTGFRRALLRALPGEQAIGAWRPAAGDLGLQVLEWWAYLGDVLTFYNERIANESYLRTATQATSIANLVALLGYQPAPGLAAAGSVAAVRTSGNPGQPLVIPAGMQLASGASAGVPSQTFEVDAQASFPGPSNLPVTLPADTTLALNVDGTLPVMLAGTVGGVKVGDELILVADSFAGSVDDWCQVTVSAIAPATDPGTGAINTLVTLSGAASGWQQNLQWLSVLVSSQPDGTGYRLMRPTSSAALWNQGGSVSASVSLSALSSGGGVGTANLSAVVRAISPGDLLLFDGGLDGSALAVVTANVDSLATVPNPNTPSSASTTQPGVIITHTQLTIALGSYSVSSLSSAAKQPAGSVVVRYGLRDVGTIIGVSAATLASLPATVLTPATGAPPVDATALLQDSTGAGVEVTVTGVTISGASALVTMLGSGTPPATIITPLAVPLTLLLDVVGVSRGASVTDEVLGSGNAALAGQAFTLANSPLTYLAGAGGPVSTLAVYVGGIRWQEVPSFYGEAADARVFVVSRSADQTVTTITFGDGVNGARLPSGADNVLATYRYGSGAASPPAGQLTTITQPQPNLASIQNPVAVSGGADPQAAADVRTDAPRSVSTFGRAISAADYELIASRAPGVTRATAYWTFDGAHQRTLVTVYVGDDEAAVAAASSALAGAEDPSRPISVLAATPNEIGLSCTLVVSEQYEVATVVAAATAAITDPVAGLFSPAGLGIGDLLYRSAVSAVLMVPGVIAVHQLLVRSSEAEVLDPGVGGFFSLVPGDVAIEGVSELG
jgi:hypothetical protein